MTKQIGRTAIYFSVFIFFFVIQNIEKEIRTEVDAALEKAKADAFPELKETWNNVYQNPPYYVRATELPNSRVVE